MVILHFLRLEKLINDSPHHNTRCPMTAVEDIKAEVTIEPDPVIFHIEKAKKALREVAKQVNLAVSKMPEIDDAQKHMFAAATITSAMDWELKVYIAYDLEKYYSKEELYAESERLISAVEAKKKELEKPPDYYT